MKVIVCVDDRMGMLFNKRRQSKDALVRKDMLELLPPGEKLHVNEYTAGQFLPEEKDRLQVDADFPETVGEEEYCFVETVKLSPLKNQIREVVLYRWNRSYPGDLFLDLDLTEYRLDSVKEFVGNSHPEMVREIYVK